MVAKQSIFLIVTLCALVYITFGTDVFDTSFTDEQYAALIVMTKLYLGSALYCFVWKLIP